MSEVLLQKSDYSKRYGLTLIEMMGVAILLGIMAIIAGQAVYKSIENGKNRTVASDVRAIGDALELYSIENNDFPNDLQALVTAGYLRDSKDIVDKWSDTGGYYKYCKPNRASNGWNGIVWSVGPNGSSEIMNLSAGQHAVTNQQCNTTNLNSNIDEVSLNLYYIIRVK